MTTLTEGNHTGEFIVSEANGYRSRGEGTVASGNTLVAGAVVQLTGGEYVPLVAGGTDPVAISYAAVDASAADADGAVVIARDAEVAADKLTYTGDVDTDPEIAAVVVRLAAVGIKVV